MAEVTITPVDSYRAEITMGDDTDVLPNDLMIQQAQVIHDAGYDIDVEIYSIKMGHDLLDALAEMTGKSFSEQSKIVARSGHQKFTIKA